MTVLFVDDSPRDNGDNDDKRRNVRSTRVAERSSSQGDEDDDRGSSFLDDETSFDESHEASIVRERRSTAEFETLEHEAYLARTYAVADRTRGGAPPYASPLASETVHSSAGKTTRQGRTPRRRGEDYVSPPTSETTARSSFRESPYNTPHDEEVVEPASELRRRRRRRAFPATPTPVASIRSPLDAYLSGDRGRSESVEEEIDNVQNEHDDHENGSSSSSVSLGLISEEDDDDEHRTTTTESDEDDEDDESEKGSTAQQQESDEMESPLSAYLPTPLPPQPQQHNIESEYSIDDDPHETSVADLSYSLDYDDRSWNAPPRTPDVKRWAMGDDENDDAPPLSSPEGDGSRRSNDVTPPCSANLSARRPRRRVAGTPYHSRSSDRGSTGGSDDYGGDAPDRTPGVIVERPTSSVASINRPRTSPVSWTAYRNDPTPPPPVHLYFSNASRKPVTLLLEVSADHDDHDNDHDEHRRHETVFSVFPAALRVPPGTDTARAALTFVATTTSTVVCVGRLAMRLAGASSSASNSVVSLVGRILPPLVLQADRTRLVWDRRGSGGGMSADLRVRNGGRRGDGGGTLEIRPRVVAEEEYGASTRDDGTATAATPASLSWSSAPPAAAFELVGEDARRVLSLDPGRSTKLWIRYRHDRVVGDAVVRGRLVLEVRLRTGTKEEEVGPPRDYEIALETTNNETPPSSVARPTVAPCDRDDGTPALSDITFRTSAVTPRSTRRDSVVADASTLLSNCELNDPRDRDDGSLSSSRLGNERRFGPSRSSDRQPGRDAERERPSPNHRPSSQNGDGPGRHLRPGSSRSFSSLSKRDPDQTPRNAEHDRSSSSLSSSSQTTSRSAKGERRSSHDDDDLDQHRSNGTPSSVANGRVSNEREEERQRSRTSQIKRQGGIYFKTPVVEFERTPVGTCGSCRVRLCNPSNENVIVSVGDDLALPFVVFHRRVPIKPRSYVKLPVRFVPVTVGSFEGRLACRSNDGSACEVWLRGVGGGGGG